MGPTGLTDVVLQVSPGVGSRSRSQSQAVSPWTFDSNGASRSICGKGAILHHFQSALCGGSGKGPQRQRRDILHTQQTRGIQKLSLNGQNIPVANRSSVLTTARPGIKPFRAPPLCGPNFEERHAKPLHLVLPDSQKMELRTGRPCPSIPIRTCGSRH